MKEYRGRFAPSPSGPLHFGSLVAALGSWLDARHHGGKWLVRIEDIDPPREILGAAADILKTLETFGLYWDHQESYQSSNVQYYQQILQQLFDQDLIYRCTCTRKEIQSTGGVYNNLCRAKQHPDTSTHSLRLKVTNPQQGFDDLFQGHCKIDQTTANEDFILRRKDGLYAYMLAVVIDDHRQKISHVIRGADLLATTSQQLYLFERLNITPPLYGHIPLVVDDQGLKLSKQNHAQAISIDKISETLFQALTFLKQSPPDSLKNETKETLLNWAIQHWTPEAFSGNKRFTYRGV